MSKRQKEREISALCLELFTGYNTGSGDTGDANRLDIFRLALRRLGVVLHSPRYQIIQLFRRASEYRSVRVMRTPARATTVPKPMLRVYEAIVSLTDAVCDEHLDSEYKTLSRAMAAALCRKRQSPLGSGQPRSWACGIVYVLGRVNFLNDPSFSPHMKTAELAAAFGVSEATIHAKARFIEKALEARVIDLDGVYDPCRPNDRLLLGMKGSSRISCFTGDVSSRSICKP
jgi:hypothetical protein